LLLWKKCFYLSHESASQSSARVLPGFAIVPGGALFLDCEGLRELKPLHEKGQVVANEVVPSQFEPPAELSRDVGKLVQQIARLFYVMER
jgi:hypothetical protein